MDAARLPVTGGDGCAKRHNPELLRSLCFLLRLDVWDDRQTGNWHFLKVSRLLADSAQSNVRERLVLAAGSGRAFETTRIDGRFAQEGPCQPRMPSVRVIEKPPHAASNSEPRSKTWKAGCCFRRCTTSKFTDRRTCGCCRCTTRNLRCTLERLLRSRWRRPIGPMNGRVPGPRPLRSSTCSRRSPSSPRSMFSLTSAAGQRARRVRRIHPRIQTRTLLRRAVSRHLKAPETRRLRRRVIGGKPSWQ